jgi:hypothetical protein
MDFFEKVIKTAIIGLFSDFSRQKIPRAAIFEGLVRETQQIPG